MKGDVRMGFDREDFYDECKSYVTAIDMLEYIEDYLKYDLPESVCDTLRMNFNRTIEHMENKYHNGKLRH